MKRCGDPTWGDVEPGHCQHERPVPSGTTKRVKRNVLQHHPLLQLRRYPLEVGSTFARIGSVSGHVGAIPSVRGCRASREVGAIAAAGYQASPSRSRRRRRYSPWGYGRYQRAGSASAAPKQEMLGCVDPPIAYGVPSASRGIVRSPAVIGPRDDGQRNVGPASDTMWKVPCEPAGDARRQRGEDDFVESPLGQGGFDGFHRVRVAHGAVSRGAELAESLQLGVEVGLRLGNALVAGAGRRPRRAAGRGRRGRRS